MHAITWSNGHTDRARSWQGMMDKVRRAQHRDYDEPSFRLEMAKRAWVWSETEVDALAEPEQFFVELQWARLIKIEKEPK